MRERIQYINHLIILIGAISFALLLAPASIKFIFLFCLSGFLLCLILFWFTRIHFSISYLRMNYIQPWVIVFLLFCMGHFYSRWIPSKMVNSIAIRFNLSSNTLLIIAVILLGSGSLIFITSCYRLFLSMIIDNNSKYLLHCRLPYSFSYIIVLQYLILEISSFHFSTYIFEQGILVFFINCVVIAAVDSILFIIIRYYRISNSISSVLVFVWGIANYYTIQFHGSPLFFSELVNIGTAATVMGDYKYKLSIPVAGMILLLILCLYYINRSEQGNNPILVFNRDSFRYLLLVTICTSCFAVAGSFVLIDQYYEEWKPWENYMGVMGYNVSLVNDFYRSIDKVEKPEGYSEEIVENIPLEESEAITVSSDYPDIILILNESFCDLHYYTGLEADADYMTDFYGIDHAVTGNAISPGIGGGTNNSEFELLTSKSMYLLKRPSPFTYFGDSILNKSVVSYLNSLGYYSTGMHCGNAQNYARNTAYPYLEFNNIYLGPEDYLYHNTFGNRYWLDADNYKDLINHYDIESKSPQFMYLLTFQNHGGYEQNDDSLDTVHVCDNLGDLTDDVNEYMTSVSLSVQAYNELIDYYSKVNRRVIICMVGDHAPSFITDLPEKQNVIINDKSINQRTVPYIIWSNYETQYEGITEYASMTDLVPMILRIAGLPLSTFYNKVLKLHELIPIRTSDGKYVDKNYSVGLFDETSRYYKDLNEYYYMEYNSLLGNSSYRHELFEFNTH